MQEGSRALERSQFWKIRTSLDSLSIFHPDLSPHLLCSSLFLQTSYFVCFSRTLRNRLHIWPLNFRCYLSRPTKCVKFQKEGLAWLQSVVYPKCNQPSAVEAYGFPVIDFQRKGVRTEELKRCLSYLPSLKDEEINQSSGLVRNSLPI